MTWIKKAGIVGLDIFSDSQRALWDRVERFGPTRIIRSWDL